MRKLVDDEEAGSDAGETPQAARWSERVELVALGLGTLVSRLLFMERQLTNWDSFQFALALREYDVTKHQPQPPGFPVYIALAKAIQMVTAWDERQALVALSVLSGVAVVLLAYALASRLYGRATALLVGLLVASNPVLWGLSEIALAYLPEAACTLLVAWFCWPAWQGKPITPWGVGLAYGLGGGVRQSLLVTLFPLLVAALSQQTWRRGVATAAVILGSVVLWGVPMVQLSGGLDAYLKASACYSAWAFWPGSVFGRGWAGIEHNANHVWACLRYALGWMWWFPVVYGLTHRRLIRGLLHAPQTRFLLLYGLGSVAFFSYTHAGGMAGLGYQLPAILAALFLVARSVLALLPILLPLGKVATATWTKRRNLGLAGAITLLTVIDTGHFLFFPGLYTRRGLRDAEASARARVAAVRGLFRPEETVILAYGGFRLASWYLPEYHVYIITSLFRPNIPLAWTDIHESYQGKTHGRWFYPTNFRGKPLALPAGTRQVVLFDPELVWIYRRPEELESRFVNGQRIFSVSVGPGDRVAYGPTGAGYELWIRRRAGQGRSDP